MELVQLYSNHDDEFSPLRFKQGLCVIVAEIRLPQNRDVDTHNLGSRSLAIFSTSLC